MKLIRTEPAPPGSLLRGETVVFRDAGRLWRCKPAEWERLKQVQVSKKLGRKRA